MNIKVLLCDDDEQILVRMKKLLCEKRIPDEIELQVTLCRSPSQLDDATLSSFHIAFLDIDLVEYNGLELARHIRALNLDTILIFVTNYVEYSLEGYEVNAFRYLLKEDIDIKLLDYYSQALQQIQTRARCFTYVSGGYENSVKLDDILYFESQLRMIHIHTLSPVSELVTFYATMDSVEATLASAGFLRIQRSYLVNMQRIRTLQYNKVVLCDGTSLPVSRYGFQKIKRCYMNWRARC